MTARSGKRVMTWALTVSLSLTAFLGSQPASAASSKTLTSRVYTALKDSVKYYYQDDQDYSFKTFDWELIGLVNAGEDLTGAKWQDKNELTAFDYWATAIKEEKEPGQLAKLAIALMKNGYDPTNFNGINLLEKIADSQESDGHMGDDQWTIFNHVLSIVALEMYDYDYDREEAAEFLLEHYDDYSKDYYTDDEAFTLHALSFLGDLDGVEEEQTEIIDYLKEKQESDGSFADSPDSTIEAITALVGAGENVLAEPWSKSVEYVLDKQLDDGSFPSAWSDGKTSEMTTEKGLIALSVAKKGTALFDRLTTKEKKELDVYLPQGDHAEGVTIYDGLSNLLKGNEATASKNTYTIKNKQLFVRADVADLAAQDKDVAVLVKVMKGKTLVDTGIVEATSSDVTNLTTGFTLTKGTYTVEVNFWEGLDDKPTVLKDPIIFSVTVK
ncbi:prenyltransferase/squalene oxidase repeat-containing protein [Brevibacillus migulae]|uniref:prenyltransferase/squalene oxidase repeat-containing protein n=1 Tax=Brevibacillus migulae TaxID=1644114 RepID=UPI00142FF67E|nr:prenyltransferase/squalene oxidase repeat-containing protein [Brevibacillus migulae]